MKRLLLYIVINDLITHIPSPSPFKSKRRYLAIEFSIMMATMVVKNKVEIILILIKDLNSKLNELLEFINLNGS